MEKLLGAVYGDKIDFSKFCFTSEEIEWINRERQNIDNHLNLPINETNFENVVNSWYRLITFIPLPGVILENTFILRARPSREYEIFEDEADISYNSKRPDLIGPGRFNRPQEAIFYGVLPSNHQERFVNAATIESRKELISDKNFEEIFYYHMCKYNIVQPFVVLNLCFEPRVINKNPGLNNIVRSQTLEFKSNLPKISADTIVSFWHYVSKISAIQKLCDQHYMVSTALFCAIREYYKKITNESVNGIIYPSPMVYGDALNIALMPTAVDKYLKADDCFIFKYIRGTENKKYFETDMCSRPSKVQNGKLNIKEVVWGRKCGNFGDTN